ncbi:ankyrin repeat-containing domain protein [Chytridium lagenaria]|nr:ankyrin repeat-containing domain protein [Chytridium lagenaria]
MVGMPSKPYNISLTEPQTISNSRKGIRLVGSLRPISSAPFSGIVVSRVILSTRSFFQAVSNKDLVIATLLVEAGADVDFVKNKMPLIRLACRLVKRVDDPGLNVARMLLARGGTVNHLGNLKGFWDGVWQNHIVKVQFLVDAGIDVNAVDIGDPLEPTALIQACRRDFMELATILLDAGADPNYGPGFPLCYVARNGNRELFDLLFSRGADIKIIPPHDHYNKGPVPELCGSRSTGATEEFLKFLLDSGCPYDGEEGDRALFRAAIYNKTGHLRLLLERGAEAGHRTLLGLKGACEEGHSEVVEMLLEAGVRLGPLTFWNNSVYEGLLNIGRDDLVVRVKKTVEAIQ